MRTFERFLKLTDAVADFCNGLLFGLGPRASEFGWETVDKDRAAKDLMAREVTFRYLPVVIEEARHGSDHR